MTESPQLLSVGALAALEGLVENALVTGVTDGLRILGYGEITLVVGWPTDAPSVACKRLPVFADGEAASAYGSLVLDYVNRLAARGVGVIPTQWRTTATREGHVAGYVVQPVLPAATLAPRHLGDHPDDARAVLQAIVDTIDVVVGPDLGLDAQLSNWAWSRGRLLYFDVTTPLVNDDSGHTRLDLSLLTSPLPPYARPVVQRLVAPGIVKAYHRRRDVVVDLIGNLHKEHLTPLIDVAIEVANPVLERPVTRKEVDAFYRSNARMWEVLLRLRRADRRWQQGARHRTYPFLLPGPVDR